MNTSFEKSTQNLETMRKTLRDLAFGIFAFVVLGFVIATVWLPIQAHISHSENRRTVVSMDGNWMAGEYRDCLQTPLPALSCPKPFSDSALPFSQAAFDLQANEKSAHIFDVAFTWKGDTKPQSDGFLLWTCQRQDGNITCADGRSDSTQPKAPAPDKNPFR